MIRNARVPGGVVVLLAASLATVPGARDFTSPAPPIELDQMILGLDIRPSGAGVAVGGDREDTPPLIAWTEDGGMTWHDSENPGDRRLYDVDMVSDRDAVAVGLGDQVLFSHDGGRTWYRSPTSPSGWLASVRFQSPGAGLVGGISGRSPVLSRTSDGGETWDDVVTMGPAIPSGASIRKIRFFEQTIGLAVGDQGLILLSQDAGETWRHVQAPTSVWLRDIAFLDARSMLVAGSEGVVLHSGDGGVSWQSRPGLPKRKFNAVHITRDAGVYLAEAEGELYEAKFPDLIWKRSPLPHGFVGMTFVVTPDGTVLLAGAGGHLVPLTGAAKRRTSVPQILRNVQVDGRPGGP